MDQDHPHGKEMQKSKMAVWGGLKIAVKRREVPGSSPSVSRVIRRRDGVGNEKTYLFISIRLDYEEIV